MAKEPSHFWRGMALATVAFVVVSLIGGAFILGAWFNQNFQIVPKGDFNQMVTAALQDGETSAALKEALGSEDPGALLQELLGQAEISTGNAAPVSASIQEAGLTGGSAAVPNSAIKFKYTTGEALQYTMKTQVNGKGMELLGDSPVAMDMNSGFTLSTQKVDADGAGHLQLKFGETNVKSDFMGSKFNWKQGPSGSNVNVDGSDVVNSSTGLGSISGIPQLEFFNRPVNMVVGADGQVRSTSAGEEAEEFIQQLPLAGNLQLPEGPLHEGMQWESNLSLPIPGLGEPIEATIKNTFSGYKTIGDRLCAAVDQEIISNDTANNLSAPKSSLGNAASFAVPQMGLNGTSTAYVDVDNGQMVHTEMDLKLKLDIGKALGLDSVLGGMSKELGGLLGDIPELEGLIPRDDAGGNDLLKLDLDIKSQVSLTESGTANGPIAKGDF